MNVLDVSDKDFRTVVRRLRVPAMGTEVVAPLLSTLVQLSGTTAGGFHPD